MTEHICRSCSESARNALGFAFTMAFQPIIDTRRTAVFAHEALVRGPEGQGATSILDQVNTGNRYAFDQACRVRAIEMATGLGLTGRISINFLPNAVYEPANCIRATLAVAERCALPLDRIIFEVTEGERVVDHAHLLGIVREYRKQGFCVAIDDFGAGWSGLKLLADFQPDILKLDMGLTRGIDTDPARRAITSGILRIARDLGVTVIAEGVETTAEFHTLNDLGIDLFQGYLFCRPVFERLAALGDIAFPAHAVR